MLRFFRVFVYLLSPFEQFAVIELFYYDSDFIFSNMFLIFFIGLFFSYGISFLNYGTRKQRINIFTTYFNIIYIFMYRLIESYIGIDFINKYFPFLFYLFTFVLTFNLVGLVPFSYTLTSQFYFNMGLSSVVWLGVCFIGVKNLGIRFFQLFYPHGASAALMTILGLIEFMSWFFRVFSLALRLMANMIAGHVLLDCVSFYIYNVLYNSFFGIFNVSLITLLKGILFILGFIVLVTFESGIALLQAYIFVVLSCIYLYEVI